MWYLPQHNIDLNLDIPPVCTRQPDHGSAFCAEHAACASSLGYSSDLRGFLKDCGVAGILLFFYFLIYGLTNSLCYSTLDTDQYSKEKSSKVDQVLKNLHEKGKNEKLVADATMTSNNTPVHDQGTCFHSRSSSPL